MATSGRGGNGFQAKESLRCCQSVCQDVAVRQSSESNAKSGCPDASGEISSLTHQQNNTILSVDRKRSREREGIGKLDIEQALLLRLTGVTICTKCA